MESVHRGSETGCLYGLYDPDTFNEPKNIFRNVLSCIAY